MSLNIFTLLGMIMLIGLVAKNAIMLVDFANHRKQEGEDTVTALIQANHARLRPILMTTIAMVAGMIPLAIANGAGAEVNKGLAIVIIGGLLSSLFLTLIVVPLVYLIFDNIGKRFGKGVKTDYEKLMIADYEHKDNLAMVACCSVMVCTAWLRNWLLATLIIVTLPEPESN